MMGVQDSPEKFRIYFLVGAPKSDELQDSYQNALKLLRKAPVDVEIVPEAQADAFAGRIAAIVASHETTPHS
jgi:hypothetical protein